MRCPVKMCATVAVFCALLGNTSQAQESTQSASQIAEAKEVNLWATETVGRLQLKNESEDRPLTLRPGSLLRWSNAISGNVYGDSYLWMDQGRPAAFLSIYALFDTPDGNRRLTFQSLSKHSLSARLDDREVWTPNSSGIDFQMIEKARAPDPRAQMQKIQMRRIAQQFSAQIAEKDKSDRFRKLRLLTSPLVQYASPEANVVSGNLFAFVDGTDPELLLMIEVQKAGDTLDWRYAAVRQNHRKLQLTRDNTVVWEVEALAPPFPNPKISDPKGVYFNTKWSNIER